MRPSSVATSEPGGALSALDDGASASLSGLKLPTTRSSSVTRFSRRHFCANRATRARTAPRLTSPALNAGPVDALLRGPRASAERSPCRAGGCPARRPCAPPRVARPGTPSRRAAPRALRHFSRASADVCGWSFSVITPSLCPSGATHLPRGDLSPARWHTTGAPDSSAARSPLGNS
jgi:hypothetical protein